MYQRWVSGCKVGQLSFVVVNRVNWHSYRNVELVVAPLPKVQGNNAGVRKDRFPQGQKSRLSDTHALLATGRRIGHDQQSVLQTPSCISITTPTVDQLWSCCLGNFLCQRLPGHALYYSGSISFLSTHLVLTENTLQF